jgi:hypothetical protein
VRPVVWHPLALEDLHEAAAFYKTQREGRDERFLSAVHGRSSASGIPR